MTPWQLITPVATAGATHLAMWTTGSYLRERITRSSSRDDDPSRRAFQSAMLGLAVLGSLAFALGAAGLLYAPVLATIVALLAALGIFRLARLVRAGGVRSWVHVAPTLSDLPMICAVIFVLAHLPRALLPILEHDENVYHLLLPKLYLGAHGLSSLPGMLFANMPHLVDLSYVFPVAVGGFTAAKVFVLGFWLWTFVGFAPFGRTLLGPIGPGLLAVLYLSGRPVEWHLGVTYVEPVIGALLLCSVQSLWRYCEAGETAELVVMSIATGAACASKYTAWPPAVVLFAVAALVRPTGGRRIGLGTIAAMAGICGLLVVPWLVKNAIFTGNPIYPNAYRFFGAPHWSPIQSMQFQHSMSFGVGGYTELSQYLKLPFLLVTEPTDGIPLGGGGFSASVMVLLFASMALPWRRSEFRTMLRLVAIAGFATWALGPKQIRYLVAWVPVMVVTAGLALAPLRRFRAGLASATIAVSAVGIIQMALQPLPVAPLHATPLLDAFTVSRDELLSRNFCWDLTQLLNQIVPPGGRVLSFWEDRLYFLDRPFMADSAYNAPTALAWLRETGDARVFARTIAAEGFTHVVVSPQFYEQYMTNAQGYAYVDERLYPAERLKADHELFEQFVGELEGLPMEGDWRVMRLKATGSE